MKWTAFVFPLTLRVRRRVIEGSGLIRWPSGADRPTAGIKANLPFYTFRANSKRTKNYLRFSFAKGNVNSEFVPLIETIASISLKTLVSLLYSQSAKFKLEELRSPVFTIFFSQTPSSLFLFFFPPPREHHTARWFHCRDRFEREELPASCSTKTSHRERHGCLSSRRSILGRLPLSAVFSFSCCLQRVALRRTPSWSYAKQGRGKKKY